MRYLLVLLLFVGCGDVKPKPEKSGVYIKEVTYRAGEKESESKARKEAERKLKRIVSEEAGTFISSYYEERVKFQNGKVSKSLQKDLIAKSEHFMKLEVLDHSWKDGIYTLKAKVTIVKEKIDDEVQNLNISEKSYIWNGKDFKFPELSKESSFQNAISKSGIPPISKGKYESSDDFQKRRVETYNGVLNSMLGKQDFEMKYDADKEIFTVFENRTGISFQISVPRKEARNFEENTKSMDFYISEKDGKLWVDEVRKDRYFGEVDEKLDLWHLEIEKWSDEFELGLPRGKKELLKVTTVTTIYGFNKEITYLPNSIGKLSNLQKLNLYGNKLKEIPNSIGNLTNLQFLSFRGNKLKEIPNSIGNLTNLQELDLCCNELTSLPNSIGNLTNLQELDLFRNKLKEIPNSIGNLTNLQSLSLGSNPNLDFDSVFKILAQIPNLQNLYLFNNKLTTLPNSIGNLKNLQTLDLSWNQLTTLPNSIGNLSNLKDLTLWDNQLTTLPSSINSLSKLESSYNSGWYPRYENETPLQFMNRVLGLK